MEWTAHHRGASRRVSAVAPSPFLSSFVDSGYPATAHQLPPSAQTSSLSTTATFNHTIYHFTSLNVCRRGRDLDCKYGRVASKDLISGVTAYSPRIRHFYSMPETEFSGVRDHFTDIYTCNSLARQHCFYPSQHEQRVLSWCIARIMFELWSTWTSCLFHADEML